LIGAALTHVVAVAAGALLAARMLPSFSRRFHGRERPALLAVAYAVTVMFWSWRPFRLQVDAPSMAEQFSAIHLVPLMALSARFDLFTVTDIIAQFLLFLPLGALVAVWPVRRAGWLRGMWPVVYLSVVLEFGKIVVAERFLDVTHVLIQCAGAGIGWALVRRAGFEQYGEILPATTRTDAPLPADVPVGNARGRPDWGGLRRKMRRIVRRGSAR
ncbi:MAG: VanZ family protein, partial [Gemmatimonadaceae bacterium]